ncbi:cysteine-rich receptor-like protein kinase 25 [Triticum urartu]|nr:cysteine-rich receptor-like protein kinase 25 [Triticum urartu]
MAPGFMPRRLIAFLLIFCVLRRGQGGSTTSPGQQSLLCGSQKYEIGSPYDDHVRWLLPNLTESVIQDGAISGWADVGNVASDPDDGVGCMAMCYADHGREDCAQCLRYAAGRFLQGKDCPNARNASAFYDTCMVWYYQLSPVVGFGYLSVAVKSDLGLDLTGSQDVVSFRRKRRLLLQDLSSRAIASKQYAAASSTSYYGSAFQSIYGLVQCQRFLSRENCSCCLNELTQYVAGHRSTMTIGAVKTYWCYIRYGTEKFDDYISEYMATPPSPNDAWATAPAMAPALAPAPPPHKREATMIGVIIGICSGSIVLVTGIMLLLRYLFRGRLSRVPSRQSIQLGSSAPMQFSASQLRDATNNFTDPLGSGAFGTVYKGTMGGKEVAVKKLHSKDGVVGAAFTSEAHMLMAFKHKNLVKLLGYCDTGDDRLLCFEYLSGGSIDKLIYKGSGYVLDWSGRYKIVQGICSGLHYLHHELDHEQNIVHLDLKASNVLVSRGDGGDITCVKIADFGLSKFFKADLTHSYTEQVVGLLAYMAPEYVCKGRISPKADIYSFGILILEIVTGRCAKVGDSSGDFITWVHEEWRGDVRALMDVDGLPGDSITQARNCIEIALDCIQEDPNSRPDAAMIRQRLSHV